MNNKKIISIIIAAAIASTGIITTSVLFTKKHNGNKDVNQAIVSTVYYDQENTEEAEKTTEPQELKKDLEAKKVTEAPKAANEKKAEKKAGNSDKKITVEGKNIAFGLTTVADLVNQGCKMDIDPESSADTDFTSTTVSVNGKDYGMSFLAESGKKWKDATVMDIYALENQQSEISVNGKTVVLGKTTYQNLLDDGWKTDVKPEMPEEGMTPMFDGCNGKYSFNGYKVNFLFSANDVNSISDVVIITVS